MAISEKPTMGTCVYAIRHSSDLDKAFNKGGSDEFTEQRSWSTAERLLTQAKHEGRKFVVVFAAAETTTDLLYHAELESIKTKDEETTYSFSELTPFGEPKPEKTSLVLVSTGKLLHTDFIRSYAICRTPDVLM